MSSKDTIRINFEFPKKDHPYLKLLCAKKGISIRELATELLLQAIEQAEDDEKDFYRKNKA